MTEANAVLETHMPPDASRTLTGGRPEGLGGGGGLDMPNQREQRLVATVSEPGPNRPVYFRPDGSQFTW